MSKFSAEFVAAAAQKLQFYFLLDFSKLKTLWQVLLLYSKIVQKKSFSWQNMKKSVKSSFENQ